MSSPPAGEALLFIGGPAHGMSYVQAPNDTRFVWQEAKIRSGGVFYGDLDPSTLGVPYVQETVYIRTFVSAVGAVRDIMVEETLTTTMWHSLLHSYLVARWVKEGQDV